MYAYVLHARHNITSIWWETFWPNGRPFAFLSCTQPVCREDMIHGTCWMWLVLLFHSWLLDRANEESR